MKINGLLHDERYIVPYPSPDRLAATLRQCPFRHSILLNSGQNTPNRGRPSNEAFRCMLATVEIPKRKPSSGLKTTYAPDSGMQISPNTEYTRRYGSHRRNDSVCIGRPLGCVPCVTGSCSSGSFEVKLLARMHSKQSKGEALCTPSHVLFGHVEQPIIGIMYPSLLRQENAYPRSAGPCFFTELQLSSL
jgi:hypothetical protein